MIYPAIVISTFNRPKSLERLLHSISLGNYPNTDIKLIISIDYEDSELNRTCCRIAKNFKWDFGSKEVIDHKENLGLKKHILSCGDLTRIYDTVIVLEDDLYVSPNFYSYSLEANDFYYNDNKVAGISLYCHKKNILNNFPFEPIDDNYDIYFLKLASSWGQLWNKIQWDNFRKWYDNKNFIFPESFPLYIKNWPNKTSWLKFFILYVFVEDKYFVYPKKSLTTNFGDSGTNNTLDINDFQVPLNFNSNKFKFIDCDSTLNVYDTYFEILPIKLSFVNEFLSKYDYVVDLYGMKPLSTVNSKYLLSSKHISNRKKTISSYGLNFKPITKNILLNNQGSFFNFSKVKDFNNYSKNLIPFFNYYFHKYEFLFHFRFLFKKTLTKIDFYLNKSLRK